MNDRNFDMRINLADTKGDQQPTEPAPITATWDAFRRIEPFLCMAPFPQHDGFEAIQINAGSGQWIIATGQTW